MADHERRQGRGPRAQVGQPGLDAVGLLGERLAARDSGSVGSERSKRAKPSGSSARISANERSVQSPVSVSAKRASSIGLEADARGHDVGRLARAAQRAAHTA